MRAAGALRVGGLIGLAVIWTARATVTISGQVLFDVDPAITPLPLGGYGPAGSLALDAAALLACAAVLLGERLAGRGVSLLLCGAALLPAAAVLWHGLGDAGDLWRGSTWVAAALGGVTIAHLGRDPSMRPLCLGLVLATLAPVIARGAMQVSIEHAATIAEFERSGDAFLAQRQWTPGSAQAQIYERRLRQRTPLGWFATTNVFASFMTMGLIAWTGLLVATIRARRESGWSAACAFIAVACAAGVVMSGSKGAIGIAVLALLALLVPLLVPPVPRRAVWPLLLIGLAFAAIMLRGMLPESFLGDRSLLFRWHYLQGAVQAWLDQPLFGVGPDGFQEAYVRHRVPRSPEEVTSAHSVFVDWMTTLGLAGALWIGLTLRQIGGSTQGDDGEETPSLRAVTFAAVTVFAGAAAVTWPPQMHVLDPALLFVLVVAAVIGVATAALAAGAATGRAALSWTSVIAAAALVAHGQIEMTFVQSGAVMWAMAAIGLAAPAPPGARRGSVAAPLAAIGLSVVVLVVGVAPAWRQQRLVERAAAALQPPAGTVDRARWAASPGAVANRLDAVDALQRAYERWPARPMPLIAALQQLEWAVAATPPGGRLPLLDRAVELADRAVADHDSARTRADRCRALAARAALAADDADLARAIDDARNIAQRDPRAAGSWTRLGDLLWLRSDADAAREAYRTALACDDAFELDPLKQLPAARRGQIEQRLQEP